jgi:hypothetical protein
VSSLNLVGGQFLVSTSCLDTTKTNSSFTIACQMDSLRVNVEGVQALAGCYRAASEKLLDGMAPTSIGASGWAFSAAVGEMNAAVAAAGATLEARTQTRATKIVAANSCFVAHESESAAELRDVTGSC